VESKVDSIADYLSYEADITSWDTVQHIVRAGLAPRVFQIGDQFEVLYDSAPVLFDIIGIDHDTPTDPQYKHSLTIQSPDCLLDCQFDAPEALYYAESGLPAGEHIWTQDTTNIRYKFTTTEPVPSGGQIVITSWGTGDYVPTAVTTYAADRITPIESNLPVTVAESGEDTLAPVNIRTRCRNGSNNYLQSNIRAWLNSDAASFAWSPSTIYDRPSTDAPYDGGGFLARLDPELVAVLGAVDKHVARNTLTDGGGQDLFSDKAFLLSRVEAYAGTEGVTAGELPYAYYAAMAAEPTSGELAGRIKYRSGSAVYWWLRSPNLGGASSPHFVMSTGQLSNNIASGSRGVAPAVVIV
jgi:hypothetical protein